MAYAEVITALCAARPDVMVLTAENRAAIRALPERLGDRFVDVGICEQTMVGMAAGLALRGRVPVVHALATFLTMRAFEFIRSDVGIAGLPVILVGGVPGFLSEANGPTHQALEDLALMRGIPGMAVVCPADVDELTATMPALVARGGPAYVRYHDGAAAVAHGRYVLGAAEVFGDGEDVAIVTLGLMLGGAIAAARRLADQGIAARVVNMRSLAPLDTRAVLDAAAATRLLVTVEDHFLTGGLFTTVAETLATHGVAARVAPIGLPGRWFRPALLADVLAVEGFTADSLAARIAAALEGRSA